MGFLQGRVPAHSDRRGAVLLVSQEGVLPESQILGLCFASHHVCHKTKGVLLEIWYAGAVKTAGLLILGRSQ